VETTGLRSIRALRLQNLTVVVARTPADLEPHIPAWEELAASAAEPNPFFEPWMMLPAMKELGGGLDLRVALLYAPDGVRPHGPQILCGVFPLQFNRSYKGLPVSVLTLWRHRYCFLSVPLIRKGCVDQVLRSFLDWIPTQGATLMEFQRVPGEGSFNEALVAAMYERHSLSFVDDAYVRALLKPATDSDSYFRAAVRRDHRKDIKRRARRLEETGSVVYRELASEEELGAWIEGFLDLEQKGWKGKNGGAFACRAEDRRFFEEVIRAAFSRGRLMMLSLEVNGHPVSYKCNFIANEGSFAFKIAYDESYAYYSPGLLLEIENIRSFHERGDLEWMDSCASPEHPMIDRLWQDRRIIQSVLVSAASRTGDLWISLLPIARWANRLIKRISSRSRTAGDKVNFSDV